MKEKETCPFEGFTPEDIGTLKRVFAKGIKKEHVQRAEHLITSCLLNAQYLSRNRDLIGLLSTRTLAGCVKNAALLKAEAGELLQHLQELQKYGSL